MDDAPNQWRSIGEAQKLAQALKQISAERFRNGQIVQNSISLACVVNCLVVVVFLVLNQLNILDRAVGFALFSALLALCFAALTIYYQSRGRRLRVEETCCDEALGLLHTLSLSDIKNTTSGTPFLRLAEERIRAIEKKLPEALWPSKTIAKTNAELRASPTAPSRVRIFEKIVPRQKRTQIRIDRSVFEAKIENVSRTGVTLQTTAKVEIGASARVGSRSARAVRLFSGGIGFEFENLIPDDEFNSEIVL
eukprot:gene11752-11839_t